MEVSDFFHEKLEKYVMSVEKCSLHLCNYFPISNFGVPKCPKEILFTLLKFHGQIPSHSGDLKKFPLGWWCKFTSTKFQETADHNTWYKIFWQRYCQSQILFIRIKSFQLRQFTNPIWHEVDVNVETPLISSMQQNYTVIHATLFKKTDTKYVKFGMLISAFLQHYICNLSGQISNSDPTFL